MRKIVFFLCLIVMGCSKFDDGVTNLGYEITKDVISSYVEVDGVKLRADITPVIPVETTVTDFYVLVSAFPEENFVFKTGETKVKDLATQKEDDCFEYNTLLQKTEFIGTGELSIPCFYLQEQVYYKSVPKHLMPAPEISCVYENFTSEVLEDEVVDGKKYDVRKMTFYFRVFEDDVENQTFATTSVKFYKPKPFFDIVIDDYVDVYDDIIIEI